MTAPPVVHRMPMSTAISAIPNKAKKPTRSPKLVANAADVELAKVVATCIGEHGKCGRPVLAKDLCQAHYRKKLRGGDVNEPVRESRGDLVPLSLRVTSSTSKALEEAGGAYRIGAEVLESWAKEQASDGVSAAEEVLNLREENRQLKSKLKARRS